MFNKMKVIKSFKYTNYFVLLFFVIIISLPLFYNGIIQGHDLRFHLSRIISISDGINNGNFLSYIHSGYLNNYGYANGLFYSNIFLYLPAFLKSLGLSVINSYKIFLFLCNLNTSLSMYYCVNKVFKNKKIALISSILYLMNPYRVCDVYVRAAVGEILSFIFIPFVLLGIYDFLTNNGKRWKYLTIGFSGLILSHIISTIIMLCLSLIIFLIWHKKILNKEAIKNLIISGLVCILLISFYIFPMLEQCLSNKFIVNTNTIHSDIYSHTVPFLQIFSGIPHWYNGIFIPSGIGFLLTCLLMLRIKINKFKFQKICDILIVVGIISTLFVTDIIPWNTLNLFSILQFPWRIYICSVPFLIIASSIILYEYSNKYKKKADRFILFILILSIVTPAYIIYNQYSQEYIWKNYEDYNLGGKEYIPKNVDINLLKERGEVVTSNNNIDINFNRVKNKIVVNYSNNKYDNTYLELPLLYYKGYYAINGYNVQAGKNGVVRVYILGNNGKVTVYYKGTKVAKISSIVTIISILGILIIKIVKGVKKHEKR